MLRKLETFISNTTSTALNVRIPPAHLLSQVSGPVLHLDGQVGHLLFLLAALTGQVRVERLVVADFALR